MNTYKLLDSGDGRRLEDFGGYIIDRPDPEAIWQIGNSEIWERSNATYTRTFGDKGEWKTKYMPPKNWQVEIENIIFSLKLTPFKHTGVFPEQSWQWKLISETIQQYSHNTVNVLNLFGYTGGATLAAAKAGAKVTHVDASKPAITWFRENQKLNNLENTPVRLILDDALKFTAREIRRGTKYDAVIMDPPVYGHGPKGEKWNFRIDLPQLLDNIAKLITTKPLFIIVNAYASSISPTTLKNLLEDKFHYTTETITCGELKLIENSHRGRLLSTGIYSSFL